MTTQLPLAFIISIQDLFFPFTLALGAIQEVLKANMHLQCQDNQDKYIEFFG